MQALHSRNRTIVAACGLAVLLGAAASIGTAIAADKEALAKQAQNPIASLISLPLQNNTNFNLGPLEETQNILNIQPVYPFSLGDNWNLIGRAIVPVISQPAFSPEQGRENGIGNISLTGFLSPNQSGAWTWGVGPTVVVPTNTDERLGSDLWSLGASFVALTMPGNWVIGALVSNVWSIGGSSDPSENSMLVQPFVNYNIPDSGGWYLSSVPIITANWKADRSGDVWTIPLGGGVGKILKVGQQPLNAQVQAFYNVAKPEFGADWQLRLQLQFLFPK